MNEKQIIYDKISTVLTEYEDFVNGDGDDSEIYERAADMYSVLVEIQNEWETTITAEG